MPYKDPEKRRAYQREYHRRYYLEHAEAYKKKAAKHNKSQRRGARAYVSRVKGMSSCVDCGDSNPIVLDFDHVNGDKSHNISDMVNGSTPYPLLKTRLGSVK